MIWPRRDRKSRALVRIAYLITTGIVVFGLYRNLYLLDHRLDIEGSYRRTQSWTDEVSKPLLRSTSSVGGQERVDAGKGTTFEPADTLRRTLASWKGLTTAIVEFAPYHEGACQPISCLASLALTGSSRLSALSWMKRRTPLTIRDDLHSIRQQKSGDRSCILSNTWMQTLVCTVRQGIHDGSFVGTSNR